MSRLVCDLFAEDKSQEESKLAELLQQGKNGLPNPYVHPDTTAAYSAPAGRPRRLRQHPSWPGSGAAGTAGVPGWRPAWRRCS